jgi:hypothetical protein
MAGAQIGAASAVLMAKASTAARLGAQAARPIENFGNLKRGSNIWKDHIQNFNFGFAGPVLVLGLSAKIDVLPVLSLEKRHV